MVSWFSLIGAAVTTVVLLLLVGVPLAWIVGVRGFARLAIAPAFAMTIVCGASLVLSWIHVPWSAPGVIVVAAVVAVILWLSRRLTRRWRPTSEPPPARPFDPWLLVALAVAGALISARFVGVIQAPDRISQTFDNVFHLNAVRWILDTGSASALEIGYMTNPAGPPTFYPSGWHALVALVSQLTGASVPVAINGVVLAVAAFVGPVGLLLLCRTLFGAAPALSLAAGVVIASVPLPFLLMDYGVLYPFQLGVALLPMALTATLRLLRLSESPDSTGSLWWGISLVGMIPGLALVHPGALMAWLALSAPFFVVFVATRWRTSSSRVGRWVLGIGAALYLLVGASLVYLLRPPAGARGWQPEMSVNDAVVRVLTAHPWYPYAPVIVASAVIIGLCFGLMRRTRAGIAAVGMYTVASILFIAVAAIPFPIRDLFTAPWYNNIPRVAALLLVALIPLAAYGVSVGWSMVARGLRHRSLALRAGVGATAAIAVTVLAQVGPLSAMPQTQHVASASFALTPDSPLLSSDEAALIARLDEHMPADAVIAGSPWTGTSVAYALTGRHVLMPHIQMEISDELELVNDELNEATPGSDVCAAMADLGVGYVLDFGSREVHGATHVFPGLLDLQNSPAVRLLDQQGAARLYQVVGCTL